MINRAGPKAEKKVSFAFKRVKGSFLLGLLTFSWTFFTPPIAVLPSMASASANVPLQQLSPDAAPPPRSPSPDSPPPFPFSSLPMPAPAAREHQQKIFKEYRSRLRRSYLMPLVMWIPSFAFVLVSFGHRVSLSAGPFAYPHFALVQLVLCHSGPAERHVGL